MIFVERDKPLSREAIEEKLEILCEAIAAEDDEAVHQAMKCAVPTYRVPGRLTRRRSKQAK